MESWFRPGDRCLDDPLRLHLLHGGRKSDFKGATHINVIYPRRDLASLVAACYPVVNGNVVMRYKPVFTTAGTQPYGGVQRFLFLMRAKLKICSWLG
jgi:hypothetical protein